MGCGWIRRWNDMADILIVDDDPSVRETLEVRLTREGYAVETAEVFDQAKEALAERDFDAILLDVVLPGVGGIGILKYIKDADIETPVIMITGDPNVDSAAKSMQYGAYDYISKPIRKDNLLDVVRRAVEKKGLIDRKKELEKENLEYQKELERTVEKRTEELKNAYELLGEEYSRKIRFMRKTSHDFINPLSIIDGYLTLLMEGGLSDEQRQRLQIVSENVKRIDRLVQDALEVTA